MMTRTRTEIAEDAENDCHPYLSVPVVVLEKQSFPREHQRDEDYSSMCAIQMVTKNCLVPPATGCCSVTAPTTPFAVEDITHHVASFLEPAGRAVLASVNKRTRRAVYDERLIAAAQDARSTKVELGKLEARRTSSSDDEKEADFWFLVILSVATAAAAALFSLCSLADNGAKASGSIAGIVMVCVIIGIGACIVIAGGVYYSSASVCCLGFSLFVVILPLAILSNFYLATYRYVSEPPFVPECVKNAPGKYPYTVQFADPAAWTIDLNGGKRITLRSSTIPSSPTPPPPYRAPLHEGKTSPRKDQSQYFGGDGDEEYDFFAYEATYIVTARTRELCGGKSDDVNSVKSVFILNDKIRSFAPNHTYPAVLWSVYFNDGFGAGASVYKKRYWNGKSPVALIMPNEKAPSMTGEAALMAFGICIALICVLIFVVLMFPLAHIILKIFATSKTAKLKDVIQDAENTRAIVREDMKAAQRRLDMHKYR